MTNLVHMILNFIEAFAFPFFIANYFNIQNKRMFISIVFIIQFTILNIFHFQLTNDFILTIIIILSMIISIYLFTKQLTFNNIFITLLYNCFIYFAAFSVLFINKALTISFQFLFSLDIDFFLFSCFISRILLLLITFLLLRKKLNLSVSFDFKYWSYIIILEFLLLCSMGLIIYSLTINQINNMILMVILICLTLIFILFVLNLYHLNELNKNKIEFEKSQQLRKFELQQINALKNVKHEIDALNHRMFYIYYRMEYLLKTKRYEEAYQLLLSNRKYSSQYHIIVDTKNIVFDCLVSLKINDLITNGMDINLCIFISQSKFYNNLLFINSLLSLFDCLNTHSKLTVHITEKSCFTVIKIFCSDDIISQIDNIEKSILAMSKNYKLFYELDSSSLNHIKISLKRENFENEKDLFVNTE